MTPEQIKTQKKMSDAMTEWVFGEAQKIAENFDARQLSLRFNVESGNQARTTMTLGFESPKLAFEVAEHFRNENPPESVGVSPRFRATPNGFSVSQCDNEVTFSITHKGFGEDA